MNSSIRAFIAISINQKIKQEIEKAQIHFKEAYCDIKWVNIKNTHLTLKFFKKLELNQIEVVNDKLSYISNNTTATSVFLGAVGAFPKIEKPKVLYFGLEDNLNTISNLADTIDKTLFKKGFAKNENIFKPHITLGRVKSNKNINKLSKMIQSYSLPPTIKQNIDHIKLIKSTLTPNGPIYETIKSFSLDKSK